MFKSTRLLLVPFVFLCAVARAQSVIDIGIPANDVAFNAVTGQLYAAVPSSAGLSYGNRLVEISPIDGSILRSVFVGSEPKTIGMSPDAAVAYVGLDGAGLIYPVDLTTMTTGPAIALGNTTSWGPRFAEQIVVAAGAPQTFAVARRDHGFSPRYAGIAIYDGDVMRPNTDNGFTGGNTIAYGSTPIILYGYDNEVSDFVLEKFAVSASGVNLATSVGDTISGYNVKIVSDGDTLVATSGAVVNGTLMQLVGRYTIPGGGYAQGVVLDNFTSSAVFVTYGTVETFDRDTFIPVKSLPVAVNDFATNATTCGRPACIAIAYGADSDAVIVQDVRDIFSGTFEQ